MIGIVVSRADPASTRIGDALLDIATWDPKEDGSRDPAIGGGTVHHRDEFELRTFDRPHLELEHVATVFDEPDAVIFVSKHAGETGPLLTTHVPGNVGEAEYGGEPNTIPLAAPALERTIFHALERRAPTGFEVSIECTHHGPSTVGAPALFVEVGSGPRQWNDPVPAEAAARAVLDVEGVDPGEGRSIVGFGGGHYAPRFTRILRDTMWNVGHIAAQWSLDEIGDSTELPRVVTMAIERSDASVALIDGEDAHLANTIAGTGTPVVSETWIREADGVPLRTIERIEDRLGPIDEGARVGARASADPTSIRAVSLPEEIVDAVNGHEPQSAIDAVTRQTVAYATTENGKRLSNRVILDSAIDRRAVVDALRPALASRFDEVRMTADTIVLRERRFDPDAAAALGVPEGPAFGRLAEGETVTVDGERIDPEAVTRIDERRIPVGDD